MEIIDLSTDGHIHLLMKGHTSVSKFIESCKKLSPHAYTALVNEGYIIRRSYLVITEDDGNLFYNETSQSSGEKYMVWEGYI